MGSSRSVVMIGLSVLAGLLAAFLAVRWLDNQAAAAKAEADAKANALLKVAILAGDVKVGRELTADLVKMVDWPAQSIPEGAVRSAENAVGRTARVSLYKGEPVLEGKLSAKGTRGGLSAIIKPGKRAISVGVNDVVGVNSAALEGSYVDVLVNSSNPRDEDRQSSISKIVLERVLVLAVSESSGAEGRVNGVTLEVTPGEAEKLDLARSIGRLSLVLRSQGEEESSGSKEGATKDALFGFAPRPAPKPVAAPVAQAPTPVAVAPPPPPKPVVVREPPKPVVPPPAPVAPKTCVDALVGSERRTECF